MKLLREVAMLGLTELADLAELTKGHLSDLESEKRRAVQIPTVLALARVFGVSTDYLLTGRGAPVAQDVRHAVARAQGRTREAALREAKRHAP